jgi:hypothetical protein
VEGLCPKTPPGVEDRPADVRMLALSQDSTERLCRRFMAELDPGASLSASAAAGRELAGILAGMASAPAPLPQPIFRSAALAAADRG